MAIIDEKSEVTNERSGKRDQGGSVGSDTRGKIASGGSGSGGSDNGSGGSDNGSGGSDNGSEQLGTIGSDTVANDSGSNANDVFGNTGIEIDGDELSGDRNSGSDRGNEQRRSFRLGDVRDRIAADAGNDRNDRTGTEKINDNEINFRLGQTTKRKPRKTSGSESVKNTKLSDVKDYVSVFIGSIFEIPAITLNQPFWKLTDDENEALTSAVIAYIDSLPKSKGNKYAKFMSENLPLLNLCFVGFFIVGGRVKQSFEIADAKAKIAKAAKQQNIPNVAEANFGGVREVRTPLDMNFG